MSLITSLISWGKFVGGWSDIGSLLEKNWVNEELEVGIIFVVGLD